MFSGKSGVILVIGLNARGVQRRRYSVRYNVWRHFFSFYVLRPILLFETLQLLLLLLCMHEILDSAAVTRYSLVK